MSDGSRDRELCQQSASFKEIMGLEEKTPGRTKGTAGGRNTPALPDVLTTQIARLGGNWQKPPALHSGQWGR